ncbi:Trihelix transcription factor GT-3a [Orchesella cincta]|uniref:Trihelix transcription factor GT-3a n=1 Tax=Orchesella cincta TaxID=48709 RepID=A0A1D2MMV5_ORCCI|nr:Trihelix transcription factor GT-3a [Orchesella cincta]
MRPYVHEEQGQNSVSLNLAEDSEEYIEEPEEYQAPRRSVGLVGVQQHIQRAAQPQRTYAVVSNPSSGANTLALIQRRAAQRKLQMAKMIGNGGLASSMNFHRVATHHQTQEDSRHDRQNDAMYVASRRARSNNFTLKETFDLLKIWASPEMQWQMKHNFRNFRVWEAISYSMHEMGHDRTAIQCKNRIQNLTSIFYRIKKSKQDYRSFNFPYYKLIGEVLDGKKNGTTAALAGGIELSPALAKFATNYTGGSNGMMNNSHNNSSSGRIAAHMALVEEYQHLINGNPETNIASYAERNSSSNGSSSMNVLSPEVSLSEGNSPIRVEAQASGSRSSAKPSQSSSTSNPKANGVNSMSFVNRNGGNSTNTAGSMKLEHEDNVTITVEDGGSCPSEHDQDQEASDYDDSYMGVGDESPSGRNGGLSGMRAGKRSFSSTFNPYMKSEYGRGGGGANAGKRPRVASTATNASSSMDDPIGQYLAEMVDIERQWLEMERERAENERAMMMYMMQILQAIVCPNQSQEDEGEEGEADGEGEEEGNETENDREGAETEFAETEQEADDNEIRQMIEQEENQIPNGEAEND